MTTRINGYAPQTLARIAGALYVVVIAGGLFAEMFVRQRLVVNHDPATTVVNILAHQQLMRWGFAAELLPALFNIPITLIFFELFKVVNRRLALMVVYFSLVGTAIECAAMVGHLAPVLLLTNEQYLKIDPALVQARAYMALKLQSIGFAIALTFFGGFCLSLGRLIFQSGFMPRFIGVMLAIEGVAYLANSFTDFLAPSYAGYALPLLMVAGLAEFVLCLWLLIIGIDVPGWEERARFVTQQV